MISACLRARFSARPNVVSAWTGSARRNAPGQTPRATTIHGDGPRAARSIGELGPKDKGTAPASTERPRSAPSKQRLIIQDGLHGFHLFPRRATKPMTYPSTRGR